ncbi:MAG: response regulator [Chloroflexi bacterium]|nr:response regulator [Chloroflexota bacterium]
MAVTLLIVHRRAAVRRVVKMGLELSGYQVLAAEDSEAALAILAHEHIDILMVETGMHSTSEVDLLELGALIHPDVRTVLVGAEDRPPRGREDAFILEPFGIEQLLDALWPLLPEDAPTHHAGNPSPENPPPCAPAWA